MKINKQMFLVAKMARADGSVMHVHCAPISAELFDAHMDVLEDTYGHYMSSKNRMGLGARRAHKRLLSLASDLGESVRDSVERGLMPEIRRLTNVALFTGTKWEDDAYQDLIDRKALDADEIDEIEGRIVFFTAASHLFPREKREGLMNSAMSMWGAATTSLTFTEYLNSLPTLTVVENSGATAAA